MWQRRAIEILYSDWGMGNNLKAPIVELLQKTIIHKNKLIRNPYSHIIPTSAAIENTSICNSRCTFCPHGMGTLTRKKEVMKNDLFFKIIDICKKEGIKTIMFGGLGEFLCDKEFITKASYIVENGLILASLTTNAMLLNEDISQSLIDLDLKHLTISIDSLEKSRYEGIRKGLSFDTVMNNIFSFLELNLKNDCKVNVSINATIYKENSEEKPKFIDMFRKYFGHNFIISFHPIHNWGGELIGEYEKCHPDRTKKLKNYCYRIFGTRVLIRVDGTLALCCQDYDNKYSLGIVENSIDELWNSPKMIGIRKKHVEGKWDDIPICKNCSDITIEAVPIEWVK